MSKIFLPKKVAYVCSSIGTVSVYDNDDEMGKKIASYKVRAAFPVEDGKKLDTAISWSDLTNPPIDVLENTPIQNIRVASLEHRGNGGRAYKVIINDLYYVDMREDVILDTMITCGIEKGAVLKGEYVWAKYGAQMKLVRVGSQMHVEAMKNPDPSDMKEIKPGDIEVGGVYESKSGNKLMYLGAFSTYYFMQSERSGYFVSRYDRYYDQHLVKKRVHVFLDVMFSKNLENRDFGVIISTMSSPALYIELKTSKPKFVKQIMKKDISGDDIVGIIRRVAEDHDKDNNPYPHNWYVEQLCLGSTEPYLHPKVAKLKLEIKSK